MTFDPELSRLLSEYGNKIASLEKRYERSQNQDMTYNKGIAIAEFMAIPGLRGLWSYGNRNENLAIPDMALNGRTLTANNTPTFSRLDCGLTFATLNGTTQTFSRADEAGLDLVSSFSVGGWFRQPGGSGYMMSKWTTAGNQGSWYLVADASGNTVFVTSSTGAAVATTTTFPASVVDMRDGNWHFIVARKASTVDISIIIDGLGGSSTVGAIPAALFNSNAAFLIGGVNGGASFGGDVALNFLTAEYLGFDQSYMKLFNVSRALFGV